jgi:MoaA/NifB/PqqE/SkfB family radical SAM enzyme
MKSSSKLPGPWRITFDTNPDLCNLNCIMCDTHSIYNEKKKQSNRIMPIEIIEKVIQSTHPYLKEIIPSTMGEPLLYPHFDRLIELVKEYNLKLNLTTNGTFPKRDVEEWAWRILPVASDVKISINGATKETAESIMVGLNFEKQIENIRKFIEVRDEILRENINHPTITFQVTFMKKNLEELSKILEMAIDMGVDRLKGHHVWITWLELKSESLKRNNNTISMWNGIVDRLYEIKNKTKSNIKLDNIYKLNNVENDTNNKPVTDSWGCPFLGKEAWIAWDGTFNVCCAPDNLRKTFGYFGNVNEKDFMELWNSNRYNELIDNWGNNAVCKQCNMRRP